MRGVQGERHEAMCADLFARGCERTGFKRRLLEEMYGIKYRDTVGRPDSDEFYVWDELRSSFSLIPDAFAFDKEKKLVRCYEVSVTNPLKECRLDAYEALWCYLDSECWFLSVTELDRLGGMLEMDDCFWGRRWLEGIVRESRSRVEPIAELMGIQI